MKRSGCKRASLRHPVGTEASLQHPIWTVGCDACRSRASLGHIYGQRGARRHMHLLRPRTASS